MSRWGARDQRPEPSPEQKAAAFKAAVAEHIAAKTIQTPSGWIKIPTGVPFPKHRDAIRCPECRADKYIPRPHVHDERFCYGCGHIGI